jgi:transcriptional regulator with XRE-family HTH domain
MANVKLSKPVKFVETRMNTVGIKSRYALSQMTGIPHSSITNWFIRENAKPSFSHLPLLANVLKCSEQDIIDGAMSGAESDNRILKKFKQLNKKDQKRMEEMLDMFLVNSSKIEKAKQPTDWMVTSGKKRAN